MVLHPSSQVGAHWTDATHPPGEENDGLVSHKAMVNPLWAKVQPGRSALVEAKNHDCVWGICGSWYFDATKVTQTGQWYTYNQVGYDHLQVVGFQLTSWTGPFVSLPRLGPAW